MADHSEHSDFAPGDILSGHGRDSASAAVCLGTRCWPFCWPAWLAGPSHVLMVSWHPQRPGKLALWESTAGCSLPDLIAGEPIDGVQVHGIDERIADYDGLLWHHPLTPSARTLFLPASAHAFLLRHHGEGYDYYGAWRSRETPLAAWERKLAAGDPDGLWFCSEAGSGFFCGGFGGGFERVCRVWHPAGNQLNPRQFLRAARQYGAIGGRRRLK